MLGKILGKQKDDFFMELPVEGDKVAVETPMAPAIRSEEDPTPETAPTAAEANPVAPAPAPVTVAANDPESIIVVAVQAASQAATSETLTITGFAENYLLNIGNRSRRRRPGANMAAFKSMAQTIKR